MIDTATLLAAARLWPICHADAFVVCKVREPQTPDRWCHRCLVMELAARLDALAAALEDRDQRIAQNAERAVTDRYTAEMLLLHKNARVAAAEMFTSQRQGVADGEALAYTYHGRNVPFMDGSDPVCGVRGCTRDPGHYGEHNLEGKDK